MLKQFIDYDVFPFSRDYSSLTITSSMIDNVKKKYATLNGLRSIATVSLESLASEKPTIGRRAGFL